MTIDVADFDGARTALQVPLAPGRAADSGSRPVALSNEDVAMLGIITETAPATDTASSGLNGRLQRIAQHLTTMLTGLVLAAGSAIIGKVGIDQTTPGTTDHVTGSGFATAVGATMPRTADTNAYAVGDIVAQSVTAGSCSGVAVAVARANDKTGMLRRCRVKVNDTAWLSAQLYIHVFKDTPTFTNGDNAVFVGGVTESNYIGAFDVTLDRQFSDPYVKGVGAPRAGVEMNFEPSSGTQNVYYVIETRTVVTPASAKTFTVVFEVLQN